MMAAFIASGFSGDASAQDGDWVVHLDTLGYTDTDATQVLSPQIGVRRRLDEEDGEVSGRFTIDAISSASVDVVSHATQGFGEVRYQGDVGISKRFGAHLPGLRYRVSVEPDYVSHMVGASLRSRLGSPDSVLGVGYAYSYDTVSRSGSSNDAFSALLQTHTTDLSFTQTLSPRTLLRLAYTLTAQAGYMEKPYRHVPLFAPGTVVGGFDDFNSLRYSIRPPENVPDRRFRNAFAARLMHFVPSADVTLRFDYQFYVDDWGLLAHTLEPRVNWQVSDSVDLGVWVRTYRQNAASFWERTYTTENEALVPQYRSADRDLSPYTALTGGLHVGWRNERWGFYADGSVVQTFYDDFLYLDRLTAIVVQSGVRFTR